MELRKDTRSSLLLASTVTMFSTGVAFSVIGFIGVVLAFIWTVASYVGQTDGITALTPFVILGVTVIPAVLILGAVMTAGVTLVSIKAAVSPGQRRAPGIVLGVCAVSAYPVTALMLLALDHPASTVVSIPAIVLLITSPWWGPLSASDRIPPRTTRILLITAMVSAALALLLQLP